MKWCSLPNRACTFIIKKLYMIGSGYCVWANEINQSRGQFYKAFYKITESHGIVNQTHNYTERWAGVTEKSHL